MSDLTVIEVGHGGEVEVRADRVVEDSVMLMAFSPSSPVRGVATLWLTPGEAVRLSRALVAAAAEALGVSV